MSNIKKTLKNKVEQKKKELRDKRFSKVMDKFGKEQQKREAEFHKVTEKLDKQMFAFADAVKELDERLAKLEEMHNAKNA